MNSDDERAFDEDSNAARPEATEGTEPMEAGISALNERYVRLLADFDNYRKRTSRDSDLRAGEQKENFIRELLPVVDNLERALTAHTSSTAVQLRRGIELTHQQLMDLLSRHGVEPDECLGKPFDPHRHEAMQIQYDPAQPDQVVLEVVQRGYRRGDDVIRPARVIVNDLSRGEASPGTT